MVQDGETDTLILGIGNILWADEGFGVRCVETLNARYDFDDNVRLMDGGTQGMFLLPWITAVSRLLIFDAIDFGLAPGELRVLRDDDVPQYLGAKKVSMHQTGFQEVLVSARLLSDRPQQLALIGVEPELLDDYGGSLRDVTRRRIPEAVDCACSVLREWGVGFRERVKPLRTIDLIGPGELDMASYELGEAAMTHPLIQRLFDDYGYPEVTLGSHDAFINQPGVTVLFFAGDPKRFRETTDVAVVLPELVKAFQGGLIPGVVAVEAEKALQQHYGFTVWPALVFLRDGGYLGTITGVQNWAEYLQEISQLIKADIKSPPGFKVPVVSG